MTILLGLDLEATGLNPETDKIIEAGFCLWDTERGPLEMQSYIIHQDVTLSAEIVKITGITQEMMEGGYPESRLADDLFRYSQNADYFVAHNAPFDAAFIKYFLQGLNADIEQVRWIDSMQDIPQHAGKKLIHAAAEEGMLNPFPHRALPDVLTMLTLLSRFDFAEIERYATAPTRTLYVEFPYNPDRVTKIKSLGGWKFDSNLKRWFRTCKEFNINAEAEKAKAAGFQPYAEQVQEGAA